MARAMSQSCIALIRHTSCLCLCQGMAAVTQNTDRLSAPSSGVPRRFLGASSGVPRTSGSVSQPWKFETVDRKAETRRSCHVGDTPM